jgi:hypothetical protein
MYLIKGGQSESGERVHVFVDHRPPETPAGWVLIEDVTLTAHPLPDDPDAPTVRVVLYRDPNAPNQYHYLLSKLQAKHLRRVGGTPFVYPTWEEFARVHPSVLAEIGD